MSGIGNIYRSEILWRQSVHPETPRELLAGKPLINLGRCKELLNIGVKHNAIITVEGARPSKGRYRERVNIFKSHAQFARNSYAVLRLVDGEYSFARNASL